MYDSISKKQLQKIYDFLRKIYGYTAIYDRRFYDLRHWKKNFYGWQPYLQVMTITLIIIVFTQKKNWKKGIVVNDTNRIYSYVKSILREMLI